MAKELEAGDVLRVREEAWVYLRPDSEPGDEGEARLGRGETLTFVCWMEGGWACVLTSLGVRFTLRK